MNQQSTDLTPLRMLLSAAAGFIAGSIIADLRRHRTCLLEVNQDLRRQLEQVTATREPLDHEFRRLLAVAKGLEKPTQ